MSIRRARWSSSCLVALVVLAAPASASAAVWGCFDDTRLNYAAGVLANGADHDELRALIVANGDTLAPTTAVLDAAYLGGVDVFYTSLLSSGGPVLSAAEQTALVDWMSSGGTLIVTGGSSSGFWPSYDAFTSPFGVTGWGSTGGSTATVIAAHPLTAGIANLVPNASATFSYGMLALELAEDSAGNPFMAVVDPDTGYCDGGRMLVLGDHNIFDDNNIANADNQALAQNMVTWAAGAFGCGVCGNGVIEPGEQCDDGNLDDTDACLGSCENASCGDGFTWAGTEDCDDGNGDDTDACLSNCEAAACGDGIVWAGMESCDDGNGDDTDECPGSCEPAVCGDGYVWAGMEPCDDGNDDDTDACLSGCVAAVCGDGLVQAGVEECDDGNEVDDDECSNACVSSGAGTSDATGADSSDGSSGEGGTNGGTGVETNDDTAGTSADGGSDDTDGAVSGWTTAPGTGEVGGCSCRSGSSPGAAPWWGGLLLLARRRRRRG